MFLPYRVQARQENLLLPVAQRAGLTCAAIFGLAGLAGILGGAVLPLLLVAAGTSPRAVALCRRLIEKVRPIEDGPTGEDSGPRREICPSGPEAPEPTAYAYAGPVHELNDAELCRTWRGTYLVVIRAGTPQELDRICALRSACLDEPQRRDPTAFTAWINSGRGPRVTQKSFSHTIPALNARMPPEPTMRRNVPDPETECRKEFSTEVLDRRDMATSAAPSREAGTIASVSKVLRSVKMI